MPMRILLRFTCHQTDIFGVKGILPIGALNLEFEYRAFGKLMTVDTRRKD